MKFYFTFLLCLLQAGAVMSQTNYYVSQEIGNDSNNGTSPTTPFESLDPIFRGSNPLISPGDIVNIMGEFANASYNPTYSFDYGGTPCDPTDDNVTDPHIWHGENTINIRNINGTPGNYITIKPYNGSTILKGDGANIFRVAKCSYLKIENFVIQGEAPNITLQEAFALQFLYVDPNDYPDPDFSALTAAQVSRYVDLCQTEEEVDALTFMGSDEFPNGVPRPSYTDTRGMYLTDVHHIDITGNDIQDMPGGGLRVAKGEYINIIDNEVAYNSVRSFSGTHGLVVTLASADIAASSDSNDDDIYRIKILRNRIHHNYNEVYSWDAKKTSIEAKLDEGKGISLQRNEVASWVNGSARFLVANNVCYWNGFSGVHTNDGQHMDFINNTCYNNSWTNSVTYVNPPVGVGYDPFSNYDPYEGYTPAGGNIGISSQGSEDIVIKNNISVIDGTLRRFAISTDANNGIDDNGNAMVITNNVIYVDNPGEINDFREDPDIVAVDEMTIVADPLFTNPSSSNFTLQAGSPAIGHADAACAPADDFTGAARDAQPDAGAYEGPMLLPVDLVSFTALPNGKQSVRINWTTMEERDNDFYTVEHATDGGTWRALGRVQGKGDYQGVASYGFLHEDPVLGQNYYRLRQTDFSGDFTLSAIRSVNFKGEQTISVYPNPVRDWFKVVTDEDMTSCSLLNALGQDVTNQCTLTEMPDGLRVAVSGLPAGVYYLQVGAQIEKIWLQ